MILCVLVTQSRLTLCDPIGCSPPGFSVRGIPQARILEWVAIPFFRGSSGCRDRTWVWKISCTAGRFFTVWATREVYDIREGKKSFSFYSLRFSAPHSSTLAWKVPWMEEPDRLQSMGSLRVGHDWATSLSLSLSLFTFTFHFHTLEKEMATHSCVLAWKIPRTGEPGGLPSMGSHRVGHDWSDLAAAAS